MTGDANCGATGGGGPNGSNIGGQGGSGIVKIAYIGSTEKATGGTIATIGKFKVHTLYRKRHVHLDRMTA